MVYGKEITLETEGFSKSYDITADVASVVADSGITGGLVNIFSIGSTASISTIEYEPALVKDLEDQLEELIPAAKTTRHGSTWGDDNGFSHLRATLMGPGITVPVHSCRLVLGTWQQIILVDHDNRPRSRRVFVQVMGDSHVALSVCRQKSNRAPRACRLQTGYP
ncbi:MAG: YjbQ family protein [Spirochaetaceae bacterium]|nr:MAG: YjbQ family protein [Spirochaetaceae bacterium]